MIVVYGIIGLLFILCLFGKAWKPAGILFLVLLVLLPFANKAMMKESDKNYKEALSAFEHRDYAKAEELFKKVENDDGKNYNLAQDKLKEIGRIKADNIIPGAESKLNNGDYAGAKEEIEKALKLSPDHQKGNDLLVLVDKKIQEKSKAEEEAKKQAELKAQEEAKRILNTDYATFDTQYDALTKLQKDEQWEKIKGKYVQWTGYVLEVRKDSISVVVNSAWTTDFIAYILDTQKDKLNSINKGDTITIKGVLSEKKGTMIPWLLGKAEIVK